MAIYYDISTILNIHKHKTYAIKKENARIIVCQVSESTIDGSKVRNIQPKCSKQTEILRRVLVVARELGLSSPVALSILGKMLGSSEAWERAEGPLQVLWSRRKKHHGMAMVFRDWVALEQSTSNETVVNFSNIRRIQRADWLKGQLPFALPKKYIKLSLESKPLLFWRSERSSCCSSFRHSTTCQLANAKSSLVVRHQNVGMSYHFAFKKTFVDIAKRAPISSLTLNENIDKNSSLNVIKVDSNRHRLKRWKKNFRKIGVPSLHSRHYTGWVKHLPQSLFFLILTWEKF